MALDYAGEKFATAIETMATSSSSLQDRLHSAYMSFHPVAEDDLPTLEMKAIYRKIMDMLTVVKDESRGYVPATLAQMSDEQAEAVAREIYNLHHDIEWQLANAGR